MHCCAALSMKGLAHEDGERGTDLCGTEGRREGVRVDGGKKG